MTLFLHAGNSLQFSPTKHPYSVLPKIVLYCIVSIYLYSASCSAHQSEALPVQETQRVDSSLERTKRGTRLTS